MLTLNEEINLPRAIDNIKNWAEEIFIVDSCSSDQTVDIALENGINIVQRPFTNFGDQWNFALEKLPIKTEWVMKLDPDERLSPELMTEIEKLLKTNPVCNGYSMDLRLWFIGKPLHVKLHLLRLWRTGKCKFSNVIVNEHPIIDGSLGKLKNFMEHHDSHNLYHWYEKQNRYTTMEAIMKFRGDKLSAEPKIFGSALQRRMFLKKTFYKIPFRYQLQWLYEIIVHSAWKDGVRGTSWARLRVDVMRTIELKHKEILTTGKTPSLPKNISRAYDQRVLSSPLQKIVGINNTNQS